MVDLLVPALLTNNEDLTARIDGAQIRESIINGPQMAAKFIRRYTKGKSKGVKVQDFLYYKDRKMMKAWDRVRVDMEMRDLVLLRPSKPDSTDEPTKKPSLPDQQPDPTGKPDPSEKKVTIRIPRPDVSNPTIDPPAHKTHLHGYFARCSPNKGTSSSLVWKEYIPAITMLELPSNIDMSIVNHWEERYLPDGSYIIGMDEHGAWQSVSAGDAYYVAENEQIDPLATVL